MKFKLEIDMGNAAFSDDPNEVPRILQRLSDYMRDHVDPAPGEHGPLRDINGNHVGTWKISK